jgi:putative methyltransferase (TIGR04325 family)
VLLPQVAIEYHCREAPKIAAYGAQLFPNQHFFADDSYLANTYDFVLASAAIHYVEDWTGIFKKLAGVTKGYLYVTRLPMVLEAAPFVFVQRPYAYGYNTEYVAWCLNRTEFLHEADKLGLTLVREFVIGERPPIANAPERCQYRGFLFRTFPREGTA